MNRKIALLAFTLLLASGQIMANANEPGFSSMNASTDHGKGKHHEHKGRNKCELPSGDRGKLCKRGEQAGECVVSRKECSDKNPSPG
jgi:hypothetical protein